MRLYVRPQQPQGFPTKRWESTREAAEKTVEKMLKALKDKKPSAAIVRGSKSKTGNSKKKKVFPEIWKDYKAFFAHAQFGKCGFCESVILTVDYGDVEHYRPKSEISEIPDNPSALGQQQQASASITNRVPARVSSTGYYWLAYDWSNYLLACGLCNGLKGTIFPVKNKPRTLNPLKTDPLEHPLLLNPFEDKVPTRHLRFLQDGFVLPKSIYGRVTIETCGLYREQLRVAREKLAIRAYQLAQGLRQPASKRKDPELLGNCYELGADDAPHCGMVRSIFEEEAKTSWEVVVRRRAEELALRSKKSRDAEMKKKIDESLERMGRPNYEFAADVRQIFETTCKVTWDDLISRHTRALARDFLACKRDWEKDARYKLNWKKKFYDLASNNLSHLESIKEIFEKQSNLNWDDLKAEVEAAFQLLWKLPENAPTSSVG